jgi:hypothetical protein
MRVAGLTIFALAGVAGSVAFLLLVAQGREILVEFDAATLLGTTDRIYGRGQFAWLLAAVATLQLAAWYSARLLLGHRFADAPALPQDAQGFERWVRRWLPRLLAAAAVLPIAAAHAWATGRRAPIDDGALAVVWLLAAQWAAAVAVLERDRWSRRGAAAPKTDATTPPQSGAAPARVPRSWWLWLAIAAALSADRWWSNWLLASFGSSLLHPAWLLGGALVVTAALAARRAAMPRTALLAYAAAALALAVLADRNLLVAVALLLAGNAVLLFIVRRREWLPASWFDGTPDALRYERLQAGSWIAVLASLSLSYVLMLLFIWDPTLAGRALGAPAIVALALASWVIFGGFVLVMAPKAIGWPALTLAPLLIAAVAAGSNDNHAIRAGAMFDVDPRPSIAARFDAWRQDDSLRSEGELFAVAASGGGLRAAYWTAAVLAELDDASCGRFGRRTFVLSGVSGGALGSAVFVALLAERGREIRCDADGRTAAALRLSPRVRQMLGADFLSPPLASMLFPDAVQRFVPFAYLSRDRAWALETTWEKQWRAGRGGDHFAAPFIALYDGAPWLPSLVLNSTTVEDGKRIVASNLRFAPVDGFDLFYGMPTADMSLATAVHNSARFTYVSPAGSLYKGGSLFARLVDGGYFENSGAATLREVLAALPTTEVTRLHAILITNDPADRRWCDRLRPGLIPRARPSAPELTAPIETLLATRSARGSLSQIELIRALGSEPPTCNERISEFALGDAPEDIARGMPVQRPALGWYLSRESQRHIEAIATAYARKRPLGQ